MYMVFGWEVGLGGQVPGPTPPVWGGWRRGLLPTNHTCIYIYINKYIYIYSPIMLVAFYLDVFYYVFLIVLKDN